MDPQNQQQQQQYDPNVIIAAAHEKARASDIPGGQFVFQSALLEWTDDARESKSDRAAQAVTTLWLAYAQFLIDAKQYKSASQAYEEAMQCPVLLNGSTSSNGGSIGRLYAAAARWAQERNKRKTAQEIYRTALVGQNGGVVKDEQDRELLWSDFLEMMRATNPDLTLVELQEAIEDQEEEEADVPAFKKQKVNDSSNSESQTHVVTTESVEVKSKLCSDLLLRTQSKNTQFLPPELMAAWMSVDGNYPPQAPDPPLFSAAPPKLSDPTAKDILGIDTSIQLVERLLESSGSVVLEVCRALWTLQGVREQEFGKTIAQLDERLLVEHERIQAELDARLSVAGGVADAVRQMNDRELQSFQHDAGQQRQGVLAELAWDMRRCVCWQQQLLQKLNVPGFEDGPTVDGAALFRQSQICKYLHSAFYIRNRMGSEPHITMLNSQLTKLRKDQSKAAVEGHSSQSPSNSPRPPMARHSPAGPPPMYTGNNVMAGAQMIPMQQPQQQGHLHHPGAYYPPPAQQASQLQPMMQSYGAPGYGLPPPMMQQPQQMMPPQGLPPLPPNYQQPPPPPPGQYIGGPANPQQYPPPPYFQQ